MTDAVVLVDDLFFRAKLEETAKLAGIQISMATTGDQLLAATAANPRALIIVDLNARQGAIEAVEKLAHPDAEGSPRRVIAFLSHVQVELAQRARAAGCQQVMPRSQFTQNLVSILRSAKS